LQEQHTLPPELTEAAEDVARMMELDRDWLNAGALGVLAHHLPEGYEDRLRSGRFGNLMVSVLDRQDLIRLKLFAAADEGPGSVHLLDLLEISLTPDELRDAAVWVRSRFPDGQLPTLDAVMEILERISR
jgi:hypothetical protein